MPDRGRSPIQRSVGADGRAGDAALPGDRAAPHGPGGGKRGHDRGGAERGGGQRHRAAGGHRAADPHRRHRRRRRRTASTPPRPAWRDRQSPSPRCCRRRGRWRRPSCWMPPSWRGKARRPARWPCAMPRPNLLRAVALRHRSGSAGAVSGRPMPPKAARRPADAQHLLAAMFETAELAQDSLTTRQIAEAAARLAATRRTRKWREAIRRRQDAGQVLAELYRQRDDLARGAVPGTVPPPPTGTLSTGPSWTSASPRRRPSWPMPTPPCRPPRRITGSLCRRRCRPPACWRRCGRARRSSASR